MHGTLPVANLSSGGCPAVTDAVARSRTAGKARTANRAALHSARIVAPSETVPAARSKAPRTAGQKVGQKAGSSRNNLVCTVDRDVKRRASISYYLNSRGFLAEPFETIDELIGRRPKAGVVLVHDDERTVGSLVQQLCQRHTWLPVVAFSEEPEPSRVVEAVLDGAIGYASWPGCGETLMDAIRHAATRTDAAAGGSRRAVALGQIEKLSNRERDILAGMAEGLSNRLIGQQLSISPRTVELHRANMLTKLGARHSADAIRVAIEASLTTLDVSGK